MRTQISAVAMATLAFALATQSRQSVPDGAQDRVAAVKQTLQQGLALARNYEWIETTVISLKGEEKGRTQNRCYYGADGTVQKVPLGPAPPAADQSGGRGRGRGRVKEQIVEKKKDEMKDYMERAAALIHEYVPPSPARIQAAKDAGQIAVNPPAGGKVRVAVSQYLKPGDSLTIDVDPATNRILALGVNSYLDTRDDVVTLVVQMNALPDGALYAAQSTLDAKAKHITVLIQNSGHRGVGSYLMGAGMSGTTAVAGQEVKVDVSASDIFSQLQFGAMGVVGARKGNWGVLGDFIWMALGSTSETPPANVDPNQGAFSFYGARRLSSVAEGTFGLRWNVGIDISKRASLEFGYRWLDMNYETGEGISFFKYDVLTQGPVLGFMFKF